MTRDTALDSLMRQFSKLPGLGTRSARRAVLHLLKNKETLMPSLIQTLNEVYENIKICPVCGNLDTQTPCSLCRDEKRDSKTVCVVRDVSDLWALERSGAFKGVYHVLGGLLSALDGIGPEELKIRSLIDKIEQGGVQEVILALPSTVEGQTTAHYLSDRLADLNVKVSALSRGVPVGGELDYLDDGTLQMALKSRREV